ncbi:hypothetical protein [Paenibacillus xylanilyticus]|uniref:Uncharacterized protein n=1 Tax=Paenibacillus xylanilyticus TaxID=248903 RepID=A0A7Y6BU17_9BACL|nr:hypothetical protein [Paenibacillus xylanilyticus]NUU73999.1 hypothetical protein [Paenibacillus xylanilyticus]
MSIKRDVNGYKIFDLPSGGQLLWAEEDLVLFARPNESCTPLTTEFDDHYDEIMEAWEHAVVERDRLLQENKRYKDALSQISHVKAGIHTDLYWRGTDAISIAREALAVSQEGEGETE